MFYFCFLTNGYITKKKCTSDNNLFIFLSEKEHSHIVETAVY